MKTLKSDRWRSAFRLTGGTKFVVVKQTGAEQRPRSFASALRALDGLLYEAGKTERGIVLLSPVEIEGGRGVQDSLRGDHHGGERLLGARVATAVAALASTGCPGLGRCGRILRRHSSDTVSVESAHKRRPPWRGQCPCR